ncbi:MAG: GAF domain-containing protein [Anaerolineae bacterium]|nr:GAF domain-containing protein [Anaerolineae bacterium]
MASDLRQILDLLTWFLALAQLVFGLYILLLNLRRPANVWVGGMFLLFAADSYALAFILATSDLFKSLPATYILAATTPTLGIALLINALHFLRPHWYEKRSRLWTAVLLALLILPVLITVVDAIWGTDFWYSGLDTSAYVDGAVPLIVYTAGRLSLLIRSVCVYLPLALFVIGLFLFDRPQSHPDFPHRHYWLWSFLAAQVLVLPLQIFSRPNVIFVIFNALCVWPYGYAVLHHAFMEGIVQRGSLRTRLTVLTLAIAVPILVSGVMLVGFQAVSLVEQSETRRLSARDETLTNSVTVWLNLHVNALAELARQPAIIAMDATQQVPILRVTDDVYPSVYLISTTNLDGMNVARSDNEDLKYYGDRLWFRQARAGRSPALEIVVGRTSGVPALVGAMPITDASQTIVGVVMFASTLSEVAAQVQASEIGETGFAYIVDQEDQILAHSDPGMMAYVTDLSAYPPVMQLRSGVEGLVKFQDGSGQRWWAYVRGIEPGLGVIVQQHEEEVLRGTRRFQLIYGVTTLAGALMLAILGFMAVWRAFRPILALTETAKAIVEEGDLRRLAPVESEDEIGALAQTFNLMTAQLSGLIGTLEERVEERTQALERRAEYLAVTARVSRVTASILDVDTLLKRVANLISERFGFYHAAIFLLDESGEWAVLRTVSSEDGKRMLARGHRLRVGEQGIVGYVSGTGRPRIALDVDKDIVWVKNPDLPNTRSEMALPLQVQNQIIGVLDVQSVEPDAFSTEDVEILRILADQIAIAIQNARQFRRSQQMLQDLQRAYSELGQRSWAAWTASHVGYRYTPTEVTAIQAADVSAEMPSSTEITDSNTLFVPLQLIGGHIFGVLRLTRDTAYPWTTQEVQFVQQAGQAIAQALEVARLLEEAQRRTARDRLVGDIANQLHTTLDPDMIMKTLVRELGHVLGARLTSVEVTGGRPPGASSRGVV